jgi:hypothetical protein
MPKLNPTEELLEKYTKRINSLDDVQKGQTVFFKMPKLTTVDEYSEWLSDPNPFTKSMNVTNSVHFGVVKDLPITEDWDKETFVIQEVQIDDVKGRLVSIPIIITYEWRSPLDDVTKLLG